MKPYELLLVALILVAHICIKTLLTADTVGPLIYSDELNYKLNAVSIFNSQPLDTDNYPPLYSAGLSLALFSQESWYDWMLFLNVIMSSAGGLALYLISRRFLPATTSFAALFLFLLWPFHVAYPRVLMSENLHVTLFLFAVLFSLGPEGRGVKMRLVYNLLLGICMAMGYMTKYLFLVAIPVLLILWAVRPFFEKGGSIHSVLNKRRALELTIVGVAFALTYAVWIGYARYSGISPLQAMGARFVSIGIDSFATAGSLITWIGIYTAYTIFSFGPYLLPLTLCFFMLIFGRLRLSRKDLLLGAAVCLLAVAFIATAVQHSWRASYNYPVPHRVLGRYLIHLWPLFLIISLVALERVKEFLGQLSTPNLALSLALCLSCLWASNWMLFDHPGWKLKFFFINSPDAALYQLKAYLLAVSAGIVLTVVFIGFSRNNRRFGRLLLPMLFSFLIGVQLVSAYGAYQFSTIGGLEAIHGRRLAGVLKDDLKNGCDRFFLVYDIPETSKYFGHNLASSLRFWLSLPLDDTAIEVVAKQKLFSSPRETEAKTYYLNTDDFGDSVFQYEGAQRSSFGLELLGDWVFRRYPLLRRAQERQVYYLYAAGANGT